MTVPRNLRGHMDLKAPLVIWAVLGVFGVEMFYRYRDGRSLLSEYWVQIAVTAGALLGLIIVVVAGWRWTTRPRIERAGDRTVIHFDGQRFEVEPGELEVRDWWSSSAFGQTSLRYMALSRGGKLVYEGSYSDGQRLLAAFKEASK